MMVKNCIISILIVAIAVLVIIMIRVQQRNEYQRNNNLYFYQTMTFDYRSLIQQDQSRLLSKYINIEDSNDNEVSFDTVFNKRKLVVRYSSLNCNACVDSLIKYTKQLSNEIGRDKIVVCAKYENKRDFHLLSRINKNDLDIYQVDSLLLNIESKGIPYMFVVNEDYSVSHTFIPHKEYPEMIKWFFDVIKPYLNSN